MEAKGGKSNGGMKRLIIPLMAAILVVSIVGLSSTAPTYALQENHQNTAPASSPQHDNSSSYKE
jgi:cell division protein FtsL